MSFSLSGGHLFSFQFQFAHLTESADCIFFGNFLPRNFLPEDKLPRINPSTQTGGSFKKNWNTNTNANTNTNTNVLPHDKLPRINRSSQTRS